MNSIITNEIIVENPTPELVWWCQDNLTLKNPDYETLMRIGKEQQARRFPEYIRLYVDKLNTIVIPFGCINSVWDMISKDKWEIKFNKHPVISCWVDNPTYPLYDYQREAVEKMLAAKGGVLVGGCGAGKTNCGIEILRRIGGRTLWICGKKDLLKQTVARMKSLYPNMKVGTITEGKVNINEVTVSTVQTLAKVDPDLYKDVFDTVIVDECHHCVSEPSKMKMFGKVVNKIAARYKYGLTATPKRNDSLTNSMYALLGCSKEKGFAPVWEIARQETKTLTAEHRRVDLDTPFSYAMLNDDGTFNYNGLVDYIATYEPRNNYIVNNVSELVKTGRKQLILCARVEQCKLLNDMLIEKGIKSVLLVGKVSGKKRTEILTNPNGWDVIVATTSLAKEGLDVPELDTLHLVSCIANKTDTVQSVGRIERICEGKKEPIVYDYVDNEIPYLVSRYKKRVGWLKRR